MAEAGNILQNIRVLVTDVDGTLLGRRPEFEQYKAFRLRMDQLRTVYGTRWVVCTGRSRRSFQVVFRPLRVFGILPDYLISNHAFIFVRVGTHVRPHVWWNLQVLMLVWRHFWEVYCAIPRLRKAVFARVPFPRIVHQSSHRICFRFYDEETAEFAAEILRGELRPYKYLRLFTHVKEVDIRTVPFTKGLAVAELARHLNIAPADILVIGDGHNDISMMESNLGCRTACPVNAAPEVVETVHLTGGHVGTRSNLAGVIEILDAYERGAVNSALPERWVLTSDRLNPTPAASEGNRHSGLIGALLFLAIIYTTLCALASFNLIPGSKAILNPYLHVLSLLQHVLHHLFLL